MEIREYLQVCQEAGASDLHLVAGEPPVLRVDGRLKRTALPALDEQALSAMLLDIMTPEQRRQFGHTSDANFGFAVPGSDRYRVNVHRQRGAIEGAFRRMPVRVPTLQELGLPSMVGEFARKPHGLVLLTGPVGMGKTTTLLSMVEQINGERDSMIVTIEDPIEYVFTNRRSVIKQRELGVDTPSFAEGLRNALRQDPNVIVIGEMRDLETISIALTAAETGHLVLATLHSPDTTLAIQRIVDVFPAPQQAQVRLQLADVLQGVVSQVLLPRAGARGRVVAAEVLTVTAAVRNVIRENKLEQIHNLLEMGTKEGMLSRDKALTRLAEDGLITCETAITALNYPEGFTCPTPTRLVEWTQHHAVYVGPG